MEETSGLGTIFIVPRAQFSSSLSKLERDSPQLFHRIIDDVASF